MQFFVDTADIGEIKELASTGVLDGVTTNPSLVAKSGRNFKDLVAEIAELVRGPVSAEVAASDFEGMLREGRALAKISNNVAVKVPLTWNGLKACQALAHDGVLVNVTLCFSVNQALLAAKAGATFVSPFVGRLDDVGADGIELIRDIRFAYRNYPNLKTKILAASIRSADHVKQAALIGADIATLPPNLLRALAVHPLTEKGLAQFTSDWNKTGQKII